METQECKTFPDKSEMALMRTPQSVDLAITNECNLRCKYCSHFTSASDIADDLPLQEWLAFLEELNHCAVMEVVLQGGEPFCNPNLKQIIEGIVRNRMRFGILTNGTLITDEWAKVLAASRRCNQVQVSIDSSISTSHDAIRGKDSFKKATEGIKILQKYKIPVTVRVTIHKKNVNDLEEVSRFLLEDVGLPSFSTNAASYMGLCRQNAEEVQLDAHDRSLAMEKLLKLSRKYGRRITANAGPLAEARMWLIMQRALRERAEPMADRGCLVGCGGMMSKMGIRADGIMVPCILLSHIGLGRINKDSLKEVWQDHPELKRLRQRRVIPLSNFEFCQGCSFVNYCTGNCPGLAYTLTGNEDHPSPDACLRKFLQEGGKLPDEALLMSEAGVKNG